MFCCEAMENSCYESKSTGYERFPQDLPATSSAASLEDELRKGTKERIARKRRALDQKRTKNRPHVPTVVKLILPSPPKYKRCQHSGNFILDREVLLPSDHINILAKPTQRSSQTKGKLAHYIVRKLPSVTNRIKALAKPSSNHVQFTLERYSSQLSAERKQHLETLLQPQPFVTIQQSIAYAKQQRRDDAMWRRHRTKQERKLLRKMYRMEITLLKITMQRLADCLSKFYLHGATVPLDEEAQRIAKAVHSCVCHFMGMPTPHGTPTGHDCHHGSDVMEQFYIEFSEKVGHWLWRLITQTGMSLKGRPSGTASGTQESIVSVNSSAFDMASEITVGDRSDYEQVSQELVLECLQEAVVTVESESATNSSKHSPATDEEGQLARSESRQESVGETNIETVLEVQDPLNENLDDIEQTIGEDIGTTVEQMSPDGTEVEIQTNPEKDEEEGAGETKAQDAPV